MSRGGVIGSDAWHAATPGPVFLTRFSHSPKTAIGVQTGHLMRAFADRLHVYWSTPETYPNTTSMLRLENRFVARVGVLQRPGPVRRLAERTGLTWWRRNVLRPAKRRRIERLRNRVSQLYVAPIDDEDAARMRSLITLLDRPYVLHLWDSLGGPIESDPDLRWLIAHAARVLAVSHGLLDEVTSLGAHGETLLFTRPPAAQRAHGSTPGRPVRIALLGLLDPYLDGVIALDRAIEQLGERGIDVERVFIGSRKAADRVNPRLSNPFAPTGYLTDDKRDALLATCHLGFIPGPMAPPDADLRSRYSIPSRSLDFFAVGLPQVGKIHPESAAARFYHELGVTDEVCCAGADDLVAAIERLTDQHGWSSARSRSDAAWERLERDPPAAKLRRIMDEIVADGP